MVAHPKYSGFLIAETAAAAAAVVASVVSDSVRDPWTAAHLARSYLSLHCI